MGMESAKPLLEGEVGCRGGGGAEKGSRYQSFGQKSAQVMRGRLSHLQALPGSPSVFLDADQTDFLLSPHHF